VSAETDQARPTLPEATEPKAGLATVPVLLLVLPVLILYGGMIYFDRHSGWFNEQIYEPYQSVAELTLYQPPTGGVDLTRGKAVFDQICALCHNTDGMGKPNQAPPFVGSEWVLGPAHRMIRIPLWGLTGPVSVKGQDWNLSMPNMGAALSDDDLAAVLTYIRQSWGNKASVVTPEEVKAVKAQVGNRSQPWTAGELEAIH
jgi:mono/diheme cytochrome c family protein